MDGCEHGGTINAETDDDIATATTQGDPANALGRGAITRHRETSHAQKRTRRICALFHRR
jgi:hypothetical protein